MPPKSSVPVLAPAFTTKAPGSAFHYVEPVTGGDDVLTSSFAGVMRTNGRTGALVEQVFDRGRTVCWGARSIDGGRVVAAAFGTQELFVKRAATLVGPFRTEGIACRTSLSDDGAIVAVQVANKALVVLDAETLAVRWQKDLKKSFANGASLDERGERLACAGTDGLVRIFDTRDPEPVAHAQTNGWVNDLDFRADRIAVGGRGKSVHVLDGAGAAVRSLAYGATIQRVSLSHDAKRCVASSTKGAALVWDVATGEALARIDAGDGVTSATFSRAAEGPTGYRLVASLGPEHAPAALGTWYVP